MISQITENLYIGEYLDVVGMTPEETTKKIAVLEAEGIHHIVSLCSTGVEDQQIAAETEIYWHSYQAPSIRLYHLPVPTYHIRGREDPFKLGLELAYYQVNSILFGEPCAKILVHCIAGIDRSPFVVASYLVRNYICQTLADAYQKIKKVRPFVMEHPEWAWWIRAEPKQVCQVTVNCLEAKDTKRSES